MQRIIEVNPDTGRLFRSSEPVIKMGWDFEEDSQEFITKDYVYTNKSFKDTDKLINPRGIMSETGAVYVPTHGGFKSVKEFTFDVMLRQIDLDAYWDKQTEEAV